MQTLANHRNDLQSIPGTEIFSNAITNKQTDQISIITQPLPSMNVGSILNRKRRHQQAASIGARNFMQLYDNDRNKSDMVREMKQTFKLGDKFHSIFSGASSFKQIQPSMLKDYDQSIGNFDQFSSKYSNGYLASHSVH